MSKCIGLIEAIGLASAVQAADTALKTGNVRLIGYEYSGYDARIVVKVEGDTGAVRAAVAAAQAATWNVRGSLHGCQSASEKYALNDKVYDTMVSNKLTIGDDKQIRSGKRPQGTAKSGKRAGVWDPKGKYIFE
ncbi:MAG: BMC domain-containing protein [Eubacterium sp.]|nr:BMC domain-containing protein [Eubacterium sp.]